MKRIIFPILIGLCWLTKGSAQPLPENFFDEVVVDGLDRVTGFVFDDQERIFAWEKNGRVYLIEDGIKQEPPVLDISEEVGDWRDNGLTGFALDPNFTNNHKIYLLYVVDRHHMLYFGTPQYHPDSTITNNASIGRVTSYALDPATDYKQVDPDSRQILIGESISTGIPIMAESHGTGTLIFGEDRSLLVSVGDATANGGADVGGDEFGTYITQSLADGIITPDQDVGAYRSQYLGSLNGKILRIHPDTGDGLSSNPFYDENAPRSPQSRIWATGLRNPFRISFKPGTGAHTMEEGNPGTFYIGDVGLSGWEELSVMKGAGENFGWPIFEGLERIWLFWQHPAPYNTLAPNPLGSQGDCNEFFTYRDLLFDKPEFGFPPFENPCDTEQAVPEEYQQLHTRPLLVWSNELWNPPSRCMVGAYDENGEAIRVLVDDPLSSVEGIHFSGFSSIPGVYYDEGNYPEEYIGGYFHADYDGWIRFMRLDEEDNLLTVENFHNDARNIIHLIKHPTDGCIYYVHYENKIRKICYGGNPAPTAVIEADPPYGPTPLDVTLSASGSFDPNSESLSYLWEFENGETSTQTELIRTFPAASGEATPFEVKLTVTDDEGASATTSKIISVNNTPPEVEIGSFEDGDFYSVTGTTVMPLIPVVRDAEHSPSEMTYAWQVFLHHNTHFHPEPVDTTRETVVLISPTNCDELYYYRVRLEVTDPAGLSSVVESNIYPNCNDPFFELTNFRGFHDGETAIRLTWETVFEENVDRIEIQRSENTLLFETIGSVPGGQTNYTFLDEAPRTGSNNYRLKVVHQDGHFEYSGIINLSFPEDLSVQVFPNPASGELFIEFVQPVTEAGFELFDASGRLIISSTWENQQSEIVPLDVRGLPNGVYLYRIQTGPSTTEGKVVISN